MRCNYSANFVTTLDGGCILDLTRNDKEILNEYGVEYDEIEVERSNRAVKVCWFNHENYLKLLDLEWF